eukprot:COSAG01_NODE_18126_length_1099_cov_1.003000_2_plen_67_part_01
MGIHYYYFVYYHDNIHTHSLCCIAGWVTLFRTFDDQSRESSLTFDFRVEACSQLMLVRSSFTLPVVK